MQRRRGIKFLQLNINTVFEENSQKNRDEIQQISQKINTILWKFSKNFAKICKNVDIFDNIFNNPNPPPHLRPNSYNTPYLIWQQICFSCTALQPEDWIIYIRLSSLNWAEVALLKEAILLHIRGEMLDLVGPSTMRKSRHSAWWPWLILNFGLT